MPKYIRCNVSKLISNLATMKNAAYKIDWYWRWQQMHIDEISAGEIASPAHLMTFIY